MPRKLLWLTGVFAALGAALAGALYVAGRPAQPGPAQYVAMGSSYAAGPMITQQAPHSPWFCWRSNDNYAHQLARLRRLNLVDMSCGGAQTRHVLYGGPLLLPAQIDALRPETTLVTLTIGGNDIAYVANLMAMGCHQRTRWVWIAVEAVFGCKVLPPAEVDSRLAAMSANLDRIASAVRQRSPRARLVLLTYQAVLPASGSCAALGLTEAQAAAMRQTTAAMADAVRAAATRNGATLFDAGALTAGHDVCAADAWMGGQQAAAPLHPLLAGMTAIAQGLDQALGATAPQ